jgi:CheY-like chemotaxis protein
MPDQVQAALAAGFDAYLTKPIQLAQLLAELDRSLASSG